MDLVQQVPSLQMDDGIVASVKEVRSIFPEKTDEQFAEWYSKKFKITEKRVLSILEILKGETNVRLDD